MAETSGGDRLKARLEQIAKALSAAGHVDVGFFKDATYDDGTPVALVAAVNEWGSSKHTPAQGTPGEEGYEASSYTPPRPFFRNMIAKEKGHWAKDIQALIKANDYDAGRTLELMGQEVKEELQMSINEFSGVPLKPATIARKHSDKQLIDSSKMLNSVGYVVGGGEQSK